MATTLVTKKLFQVAIMTAVLAALINIPFGLAFILTHFTPLLWLGEAYGWVTFMIGTVAVFGLVGGVTEEKALGICRTLYSVLYGRLPAEQQLGDGS